MHCKALRQTSNLDISHLHVKTLDTNHNVIAMGTSREYQLTANQLLNINVCNYVLIDIDTSTLA